MVQTRHLRRELQLAPVLQLSYRSMLEGWILLSTSIRKRSRSARGNLPRQRSRRLRPISIGEVSSRRRLSAASPTWDCSAASMISSPMSQRSSRSRRHGRRSRPSWPSTIRSSVIRSRASAPTSRRRDTSRCSPSASSSAVMPLPSRLAGSDAGAIRTTAVADGDRFVLNGHKRFVTSGRQARVAIIYALTDPSKGRDGLSAFIVETDTPGSSRLARPTRCWDSARREDRRPAPRRLPRARKRICSAGLNRDLRSRATIVEGGRIDIAAQAVGIGEACLEQSIAKAKEPEAVRPADRRVRGHPVDGRRHVDRDRRRAPADVPRRGDAREEPGRRRADDGRGDGEAVCVGSRQSRRVQRAADFRRPWVSDGVSGRAATSATRGR